MDLLFQVEGFIMKKDVNLISKVSIETFFNAIQAFFFESKMFG